MKAIDLPSGAVLKIGSTPFSESRELYQAVARELKNVKIASDEDISNLLKDVICFATASKDIEAKLAVCFKRCLYNGAKIDDVSSTFDPEQSRQDYIPAVIAVLRHNIDPFLKSLYADYKTALSMIGSILA